MTEVLVERRTETPLADREVAAMAEAAGGCLDLHRVQWHGTLLSADGRELVCHFSAADLESVRMVIKTQGALPGRVWACSSRDAPGLTSEKLAKANVLVSWAFEEPLGPDELEAVSPNDNVCLVTHRIRLLRTFMANDRRRLVCLYLAADAESVRIAMRDAKHPIERVWAFRRPLGV
ncbi:MAG TPA: nickel-binding protein [Polyangiaceae bacterium]|nr:nickel-binding protein [Polyangiaceae bacterium]HYQ28195.1 nickel-binding protein [Polyangiaceae bacterium]